MIRIVFFAFLLLGRGMAPSALLVATFAAGWAQKPQPVSFKILLFKLPTGTAPETVITLRGEGLDRIDSVQFEGQKPGTAPVPLKVVKVEKSNPPAMRPAARGGAGQVQLEVKSIPPGVPGTLRFLEKDKKPLGEISWPFLEPGSQPEKEPNNGFLEANPIKESGWFHGRIAPAKDVDVFAWELPAGKTSVEIRAGRSQNGSLFDPFLMIHNERGDLIKEMPLLSGQNPTIRLGNSGKYYFSLIDINDTESEFHHYQYQLLAR